MSYKCVCCGYYTLKHNNELEHEICPVCFWENDSIQNSQPDYSGGANKISLNEAKENYKVYGAIMKEYIKYVRAPYDEERNTNT